MGTLNWKDRQELLKGLRWFTFLEFNFQHVATQKIACKRCIMIRIVPIPRSTAIVVILEDPGESLDVCLHDLLLKFLELTFASDMEFLGVVALFPAIFTIFDSVRVSIDFFVIFLLHLFLNNILHNFLSSVEFFLFGKIGLRQNLLLNF